MLASNHICSVQSQYFKSMQTMHMQKVIPGDNISVLMSLNEMFVANTQLAYAYACEAYKLFVTQKRCTESDFQSSYSLLAHYGVALSSMFFAYELKTGKMCLYTSSISLLKQLATQNLLKGKKNPIAMELQDIEKKIYQSDRIRKSIKDGNKLIAVRLDPEVVGNAVLFTATIPRSAIDIDDFIVVPFLAVNEAMVYLNNILQDNVLRVTQGSKVRVITKNIQLLSSIYGQGRAQYLVSQLPDARVLRFYTPSLGASIYTSGITNIHLEAVDKIEFVNSLAEVDLSEIKLDYSQAKDFFVSSIKKLPARDIHVIAENIGSTQYNANASEARKEIADIIDVLSNREVYDFMKKYPQYFNIDEYKKLPSKYGNLYEEVNIPSTPDELKTLLSKGVYKILINSRQGDMSTMIASNDTKCLAKIYGRKYFRNYESEGNRLRALSDEVKKYCSKHNTELVSKDDFIKMCDKYNLMFVYESAKANEHSGLFATRAIYDSINEAFTDIEARKTVIQQPHLVVVRSCESKLDSEGKPVAFYKNVDVRSIVSITRLSDGVSK